MTGLRDTAGDWVFVFNIKNCNVYKFFYIRTPVSDAH